MYSFDFMELQEGFLHRKSDIACSRTEAGGSGERLVLQCVQAHRGRYGVGAGRSARTVRKF